jgi:hypothetical protein
MRASPIGHLVGVLLTSVHLTGAHLTGIQILTQTVPITLRTRRQMFFPKMTQLLALTETKNCMYHVGSQR